MHNDKEECKIDSEVNQKKNRFSIVRDTTNQSGFKEIQDEIYRFYHRAII